MCFFHIVLGSLLGAVSIPSSATLALSDDELTSPMEFLVEKSTWQLAKQSEIRQQKCSAYCPKINMTPDFTFLMYMHIFAAV